MQTRTVYACETCQPLHLEPGTALAPGRASALQVSKQLIGFCFVGLVLLAAMVFHRPVQHILAINILHKLSLGCISH